MVYTCCYGGDDTWVAFGRYGMSASSMSRMMLYNYRWQGWNQGAFGSGIQSNYIVKQVVYAGDKFVAVGEKTVTNGSGNTGFVMTSADGKTWTWHSITKSPSYIAANRLSGVAYAQHLDVVVVVGFLVQSGSTGIGIGLIDKSSTKITSVTPVYPATSNDNFNHIIYNPAKRELLVFNGTTPMISSDGTTWTSNVGSMFASNGKAPISLTVNSEGYYIAMDNQGFLYISWDGLDWTIMERAYLGPTIKCICAK